MDEITMTEPIAHEVASSSEVLRRRTIIGAAAWAAPVIAMSVASPAHAASARNVTLTVTAPATALVGRLTADAVYATVAVDGKPAAGEPVTFTVEAQSGGFGANGEASVTVVSGEGGVAHPPAMLLKAAGVVQIVASAAGSTASAQVAVSEPVAAGTIAFKQSAVNVAAASTFALSGKLTRTAGAGYPAEVYLSYPAGYSGPAAVAVDPATGEFLAPDIVAGAADGSITASATGFGTTTVAITLVLGYIETSQSVYAAGKGLAAPWGTYVITGTVHRVTPDAALPATVTISWGNTGRNYENATGFTNGQTVAVDQSTGAFALPVLTPIDTGRMTVEGNYLGGVIVLSAAGYQPVEVALGNRSGTVLVDIGNRMTTVPGVTVFAPGETRDISGLASKQLAVRFVTYPEGFTGPRAVSVSSSGTYTIRGVKAPAYITSGAIRVTKEEGATAYMSRGWLSVL